VSLNIVQILEACPMFARVDARRFQRLATIGRICRFAKGRTIFRQGDECPGMFVVGSGLVRVFKVGRNGKEHVLHVIEPGRTFAEVAALERLPCPANAEALEPTVCALLPSEEFCEMMHEDLVLCRELVYGMMRWVRHLVNQIEDVVLRDAIGRVARYLLDASPAANGMVKLPTLNRHLASHLDLTSETFSRTIRRLIDAGLIAKTGRHHVQLLDRELLRKVADGTLEELPEI